MFRLFALTLVCFISFFVAACKTSPGFQLSKDTYEVASNGGIFSSKSKVNRVLLKRAAQLTKQNGYKYFAILASDQDVKESYITTPTTINSASNTSYGGSGTFYGNNYTYGGSAHTTGTTTINHGTTHTLKRYRNTAIIKMFNNPKEYPFAFDAELILKNKK